MTQEKTIQEKLDWNTLYLYLGLVLIGIITIYASEYQEGQSFAFSFSKNYGKQTMWVGVSLLMGLGILLVDSKLITSLPLVLYISILFVLALVAVVARNVNGANAWLDIGGFKLQPSEFSKCITALFLAKYMARSEVNFKLFNYRIRAIAIILLPALLIILEKDTGSALVYCGLILVLYREGLPGYILVIGTSLILLLIASLLIPKFILFGIFTSVVLYLFYSWYKKLRKMRNQISVVLLIYVFCSLFVLVGKDFVIEKVLQPHQRERVLLTFGIKSKDKSIAKKAGYNVIQSKIAIGSGGFFGKGYLQGTQTKFNFVPEQSTDFIFCTIGEEWGFLGSLVLLGMYLALLLRIITIAERQRSKFSRVYAYCVACILFMHIMINIGMTIGILPVIGIPLPYVSYGGSSMIGFTLLVFILLKLDTDKMSVIR